MIERIHILGASGSGTTTLAKALSAELVYAFLDTDDYYWLPAREPFTKSRSIADRQSLLQADLERHPRWVLSGSLCGWGDIFIPYFGLVVYLWIPKEIRMSRLIARERGRYGAGIEPGGRRHESHNEFVAWAARYDEADRRMRSRKLHEIWLSQLKCPVLRIEEDISTEERVQRVLAAAQAADDPV